MPYPYETKRCNGGRRITLSARQLDRLDSAWDKFASARTAFALEYTRSNYKALSQAGRELVETQTAIGVWVIHPVNAVPGLRDNDPRIIEA